MLSAIKWGVGFVIVLIISTPINGLLISATWGWFIAPITGARQISIAEGIGLAIFCSIIGSVATAHLKEWDFSKDTDDSRVIGARATWALIGAGIIGPLIGLMFAWAWHMLLI